MLRHTPPLRLVLAAAWIALAALALGCSRDRVVPTAPQARTASARGAVPLSVRNPADVALVMRTQEAHTARLMGNPDVVGTGTGATTDGRPAVLVLTRRAGVAGIPSILDGVAVETRVVGNVVAYARPGGGGTIQCGTSTGNDKECSAGTIGCVVLKGSTKYFLSNNHVFARENAASIGERIDAPGRYDAHPKCAQTPILGTLADFQTISFSGDNTIDCAIAQPATGVSFTCADAGGYTPSATVVAPSVGLPVMKTGRTSGLTSATISAINVTVRVQYSAGVATFVNQIMTPGTFIRSGDSGSLMVTQSGANPVGLCFAGGSGASFENPIGPVLQKFGATVCCQ